VGRHPLPHPGGAVARRRCCTGGKGIAGSRPSGRSVFDNAIVARVARLGSGAPLSLGEGESRQGPTGTDMPTSALAESTRARRSAAPHTPADMAVQDACLPLIPLVGVRARK
jgi:hypothetical protein